MTRRRAMLTGLAVLASLSSAAAAEPGGDRVHDGVYLRLMVGPSYLYASGSDPGDTTLTGMGIGGIAMAGWTPARGLVAGLGAMGAHIFSPSVSVGGEDGEGESDLIGLTVGPFVDYYPDPTGGLHYVALAGVATMEDGLEATSDLALGVGGALGAGYEWWVSDSWSVGAMARLQIMSTSTTIESVEGSTDVRYTSVLPVVMITAAYH